MKRILCSFIFVFSIVLFAGDKNKHIFKMTCITSDNAKFAIVEVIVEQEFARYYMPNINNFSINNLLYPVFSSSVDEKSGKKIIRALALLPVSKIPKKPKDMKSNSGYYKFDKKIVKDKARYDLAMKDWRREFAKHLSTCSEIYNDIEPEYLLSIKFFDKVLPFAKDEQEPNDIENLLLMFCGIQDVRSAIPLNNHKKFTLDNVEYSENLPKPIMLPKVKPELNSANVADFPLAKMVPRSCYYVEFPNAKSMVESIHFASKTFNKWAKGSYPITLEKAILDKFAQLGLSEKFIDNNSKKLGRVVIAGWDPYFFSGTNIMMIFEHGFKSDATYQFSQDDILALSTSKKMISMAKKAFNNSKSLFNDKNFIAARKKLKKSDDENFFLYLSDYWLTNFVSPRWMILSKRIAECDVRIRLTELLRLSEKSEYSLKKLPTIKELQKRYSSNNKLLWIMRDLKIDNKTGHVVSELLGGLNSHTPIDTLKFTKVTEEEYKFYKKFERFYSRNWKQMDPLALKISSKGNDVWTNLYISPISKLSNFRQLRDIVLHKKSSQILKKIPESAFGISLMFQTTLVRPFAGKLGKGIPQILQISLRGMDMAPHVDSLKYILEPTRKQDIWSFSRMPVMLEVPTLVLNTVLGMTRQNIQKSDYPGVQELSFERSWLYRIFVKSQNDGYTRASLNPSSLIAMSNDKNMETFQTELPADIYLYADFKKGYTLHRYLAMEAAKNRIYTAWSRSSRNRRIKEYLDDELDNHVFPQPDNAFSRGCHVIPNNEYKDILPKEEHYSRGFSDIFDVDSYISGTVSSLPEIIFAIKSLESFITVGDNSLQFITHFNIDKNIIFPEKHRTTSSNRRSNSQTESEELDFDAE